MAGSTLGAGTLIAFATAPRQVALDGEGANSPFSAALTRHIGTPGLEVQQMLTRVRAEVVAATKGKQVPWSNSALLGDVYLMLPDDRFIEASEFLAVNLQDVSDDDEVEDDDDTDDADDDDIDELDDDDDDDYPDDDDEEDTGTDDDV